MSVLVQTKTYAAPPVSINSIMHYARCSDNDLQVISLCNDCLNEIKDKLKFKVCFAELPLKTIGDRCDFDLFFVNSNDLAKNLSGCKSVIVFAATIGVAIDRLIAKYSRISPSKSLLMQAIGTERVEALCDMFQREISKDYKTSGKLRFSAGYGDLPLITQKDIFNVLDCPKNIGLTLNDSLIMSPSKSVTAFIGVL